MPHAAINTKLHVHYGQIYLDSDVGGIDVDYDVRAGQTNGLAGAAQPGFVHLTTHTHTGTVAVRFEVLDSPPPVDDTWDEIVEVSADMRSPAVSVATFDDEGPNLTLTRNGPHRIRYSARHFADDPRGKRRKVELDTYLVQLWPAPTLAPDRIVKQTSADAAYWHSATNDAETTTPWDQAVAEQADRAAAVQHEADAAQDHERWVWGGRDPSPALRAAGFQAAQLARKDRDLVDCIERLTPARQRLLAVAIARHLCSVDTSSPIDWTPALDALDAGRLLPAPFDDQDATIRAMFGPNPKFEARLTSTADPTPPRMHTGIPAQAAVRAAAHPDPFAAAVLAAEAWSWTVDDPTIVSNITELISATAT